MATVSQVFSNKRITKKHKCRTPDLKKCPQKKAYCLRVTIRTPKKPHSARRKTVRACLTSTRKHISCYITLSGHTLQKYSTILVRGGRRRDIPGMKYTAIRGVFDFRPPEGLMKSFSKYGLSPRQARLSAAKKAKLLQSDDAEGDSA